MRSKVDSNVSGQAICSHFDTLEAHASAESVLSCASNLRKPPKRCRNSSTATELQRYRVLQLELVLCLVQHQGAAVAACASGPTAECSQTGSPERCLCAALSLFLSFRAIGAS